MATHNRTPEQERDAESHAPYGPVFVALLVLTGLEFGCSTLTLDFAVKLTALAVMAAVYVFLVGWYFMHLKFEGKWIWLTLAPVAFLTCVVLAGLTPDIAFHRFGFYQSTAIADR